MVRRIVIAGCAAVAVAATALPAEAAPAVMVSKIYYDSPGSDTGSNTSLVAEYFVVKNTTGSAKSISGWTVKDVAGHTYKFPSPFSIGAYQTITVRTGKGTNTSTTRYWNRGWYVWNNTTDTATLRTAAGTVVHRCSYPDTTAAYKIC